MTTPYFRIEDLPSIPGLARGSIVLPPVPRMPSPSRLPPAPVSRLPSPSRLPPAPVSRLPPAPVSRLPPVPVSRLPPAPVSRFAPPIPSPSRFAPVPVPTPSRLPPVSVSRFAPSPSRFAPVPVPTRSNLPQLVTTMRATPTTALSSLIISDGRSTINVYYRRAVKFPIGNNPPNLPPSWNFIESTATVSSNYGYDKRAEFKGDPVDEAAALTAIIDWYDRYISDGTLRYYGIGGAYGEPQPNRVSTVEPPVIHREPEIIDTRGSLQVLYNVIDTNFREDPPDLPDDWEWIGSGGGVDGYDIEVQFAGNPESRDQARYILDRHYLRLEREGHIHDYRIINRL